MSECTSWNMKVRIKIAKETMHIGEKYGLTMKLQIPNIFGEISGERTDIKPIIVANHGSAGALTRTNCIFC